MVIEVGRAGGLLRSPASRAIAWLQGGGSKCFFAMTSAWPRIRAMARAIMERRRKYVENVSQGCSVFVGVNRHGK